MVLMRYTESRGNHDGNKKVAACRPISWNGCCGGVNWWIIGFLAGDIKKIYNQLVQPPLSPPDFVFLGLFGPFYIC